MPPAKRRAPSRASLERAEAALELVAERLLERQAEPLEGRAPVTPQRLLRERGELPRERLRRLAARPGGTTRFASPIRSASSAPTRGR